MASEVQQKQITLTFVKGRDGKIIARNNRGKVCLIDFNYTRANHIWVSENEDWECNIKEERDAFIMVQPVRRLITAEENKELFDSKASELKDKFREKENPAPRKTSNR